MGQPQDAMLSVYLLAFKNRSLTWRLQLCHHSPVGLNRADSRSWGAPSVGLTQTLKPMGIFPTAPKETLSPPPSPQTEYLPPGNTICPVQVWGAGMLERILALWTSEAEPEPWQGCGRRTTPTPRRPAPPPPLPPLARSRETAVGRLTPRGDISSKHQCVCTHTYS